MSYSKRLADLRCGAVYRHELVPVKKLPDDLIAKLKRAGWKWKTVSSIGNDGSIRKRWRLWFTGTGLEPAFDAVREVRQYVTVQKFELSDSRG